MKLLSILLSVLLFLLVWASCLAISVSVVRYLAGHDARTNPMLVCLTVWLSTWITGKISIEILGTLKDIR